MKLAVICFTPGGYETMRRLQAAMPAQWEIKSYCKCSALRESCDCLYVADSVGEWAAQRFAARDALLFIGAMGIAVRAVGPLAADKLSDSPVLVMDEAGRFIIPVLAGHVGGANEIAAQIAEKTDAVPVITTATDVNETFAADVFAKKNGLRIVNREGIAQVSGRLLAEGSLRIMLDNGLDADIYIGDPDHAKGRARLYLQPRPYVLGIGCRRGKTEDEIETFVREALRMAGVALQEVGLLTSIDVKTDEPGLVEFARRHKIAFQTFSAAQLAAVPGTFSESRFVRQRVGVGNVAERAALAGCGKGGRLVLKKQAGSGMTAAIAKRKEILYFA